LGCSYPRRAHSRMTDQAIKIDKNFPEVSNPVSYLNLEGALIGFIEKLVLISVSAV